MEKKYRVGIRYQKQLEDGTFKKVTEFYLVDAISFTDAEFRAHEELRDLMMKGAEVVSMEIKQFNTITEGVPEQIFFEVKTEVIEDGAKIQKGVQLIRGYGMEEALEEIAAELRKEYKSSKIVSAKESSILGYFPIPGEEVKQNFALKTTLLGVYFDEQNITKNSPEKIETDGCEVEMINKKEKPAEEPKAEEPETSKPATKRTPRPPVKAEKKPVTKKQQRAKR